MHPLATRLLWFFQFMFLATSFVLCEGVELSTRQKNILAKLASLKTEIKSMSKEGLLYSVEGERKLLQLHEEQRNKQYVAIKEKICTCRLLVKVQKKLHGPNDLKTLSTYLSMGANLAQDPKYFDKAIRVYKKVGSLAKAGGDEAIHRMRMTAVFRLADLYCKKLNLKKALKLNRMDLKQCKDRLNKISLRRRAIYLALAGKRDKAERAYLQVLALEEKPYTFWRYMNDRARVCALLDDYRDFVSNKGRWKWCQGPSVAKLPIDERIELIDELFVEPFWKCKPELREAKHKLVATAGASSAMRCRMLMRRGEDVNGPDENGTTPLLAACSAGKVENISYLLENGAEKSISISNKQGVTPLIAACLNGLNRESLNFVEKGSSLEGQNKWGCGVAMAILLGLESPNAKPTEQLNLFRNLQKKGLKTNEYDCLGNTLLHHLGQDKKGEFVKYIANAQSMVNKLNKMRRTPLHYAAMNDNPELAKRLLEMGAKLSVQDCIGFSPLHIAVRFRSKSVLPVLLKAKDANKARAMKELCGKTAKELAKVWNFSTDVSL